MTSAATRGLTRRVSVITTGSYRSSCTRNGASCQDRGTAILAGVTPTVTPARMIVAPAGDHYMCHTVLRDDGARVARRSMGALATLYSARRGARRDVADLVSAFARQPRRTRRVEFISCSNMSPFVRSRPWPASGSSSPDANSRSHISATCRAHRSRCRSPRRPPMTGRPVTTVTRVTHQPARMPPMNEAPRVIASEIVAAPRPRRPSRRLPCRRRFKSSSMTARTMR